MQRFELLGRNGAGANSIVFKCRDVSSGAVVAVKKLAEGATFEQMLQEAAIMRVCAHQYTVGLLEAHQGVASGIVYLVMEHVEHALSRELLLNPRGLPLPKVKLVGFQLASALEFVHGKKVCHGDLKPANILLTSQYSVKLCDFGSAYSVVLRSGRIGTGNGKSSDDRASAGLSPTPSAVTAAPEPALPKVTAAASRWYCAPESLLGAEGSPASDIWAFGCILAELATGKPLMPGGESELDQLCLVLAMVGHLSEAQEQLLRLLPWAQRVKLDESRARGPLLDRIPKIAACPALVDVLRACLEPDPANRPTAQQLQAMPLFEDVRQALLASEVAAAEMAALARSDVGRGSPQRPRRISSGAMDVDVPADVAAMSPDGMGLCAAAAAAQPAAAKAVAAASGGISPPAAPPGASGSPQPPRRVSGVQAAEPVRPVSRARVSALTATIRGNPFEGDGAYTDLMPQVLRLAALWDEAREREELGPIAMAARRSRSISPDHSPGTPPSGEVSLLGARQLSGPVAEPLLAATPAELISPPASAATAVCTTPIAAAAGGCGAPSSAAASPTPPAAPAADGAPSLMDCCPAPPPSVAAGAPPLAPKLGAPLSASVGAVPYMVKAAGLSASLRVGAVAGAAAAVVVVAAIKPSPMPQLRNRAIINRARRHHVREARAVSVPAAFLASCSPQGGLGFSATLMQRELAAAAPPQPQPLPGRHAPAGTAASGLLRPVMNHGARRSFADLSELASVAEYEALPCVDTPPDVKRRRGVAHGTLQAALSSQPSAGSLNSLLTEASLASLGSLQELEPALFGRGGGGGGRRLRRSSSGTGLAAGSPAVARRPAAWQLLLPAGAAREVSLPQPISGRNRCGGGGGGGWPARDRLAGSVSSDVHNSAASEAYLRGEAP
ncbi:hypothetical protein PLESTM_001215300 [Pleodorina starrii]|nr:hypothetical protein PLESTM_001215300 [Pleodorina starrii]